MHLEVLDMKLIKLKIGEVVSIIDEKNKEDFDYPFYGININKEFMLSVANTDNVDRKKYKIVRKNRFVFSGMQTGRDNCIRIGIYTKNEPILVSPAYTTFEITSNLILPLYLFMIFNSKEKDRYGAFLSDSSVRSNLDWERFCDIELDVPPINMQTKYVAIYDSILANLKSYERGIDDLKLICDGFIEDLRKSNPCLCVGDYITFRNEKNKDNLIHLEQGIDISKHFITPQRSNSNLSGRRIVRKGDIAYCTQLNNENVAIAYRDEEDCVVSSVYESFYVNIESILNPKYLFLWLSLKKFGRYVYWKSTGTSYEFLDSNNIKELMIPIPNMLVQNSIVEIFELMEKRKKISSRLKQQISTICPVLLLGSIIEAQGGN
jgi:type I restriction enzyme S subunit